MMMSRQVAKIALSRHSQILRESTSTENWTPLENVVEKWKEVERDMLEARATKDAPLKWIPKNWKVNEVNTAAFHTPATLPEPPKVKKESEVSKKEEEVEENKKEEVLFKAKSDQSVQTKSNQDQFDEQKELIKKRLERVAEKGRNVKIERHSMIDPQKLFTPSKKQSYNVPRSNSFDASSTEEGKYEGVLSPRAETNFKKWAGAKRQGVRKGNWNLNTVPDVKSEEILKSEAVDSDVSAKTERYAKSDLNVKSDRIVKSETNVKSDRIVKSEANDMEEKNYEYKASISDTKASPNALLQSGYSSTGELQDPKDVELNPMELKQTVAYTPIPKRMIPRTKDRQNFIEPRFTISIDKNANMTAPSLNTSGPITRV